MNDKVRALSVLALSASVGLLSFQFQAFAESVKGSVNSLGQIKDGSGNILGQVRMHNPGQSFDIEHMTINSEGTVLDASGRAVGKLEIDDNALRSSAQSSPYSTSAPESRTLTRPIPDSPVPPENRAPESRSFYPGGYQQARQYQQEMVSPGYYRQMDRPVVMPATPPGLVRPGEPQNTHGRSSPTVSRKDQERALIMGMRSSDLSSRRAKIDQALETELAAGRITAEQASYLRSDLQSVDSLEERYKRDGFLSDREVTSLYKKWDQLMLKLDNFHARNARRAAGLMTK